MSDSMGLFGKIPTRGDFVRINLNATGRALASWMETATETCHLGQRQLPTQTFHALFRSADSTSAAATTIAPSVDSVGRRFPLAVFSKLDMRDAADFPAVFLAHRDFLQQTTQLGEQAQRLSVQELEERLGALASTPPEKRAEAGDVARGILQHATRQSHLQPVFGDLEHGRHHYAFRTLIMACHQGRSTPLDKPGIILDCPCKSEAHQVAWLEMIHRLCGPLPHPPGIVWTMAPDRTSYGSMNIEAAQKPARLLVSFGAMPAMTFAFLADKPADSSKLWPLWCDNQAALQAATAALSDDQREALDDETGTLESMLNAFTV